MDISGITSNSNMHTSWADLQRRETDLSNFQSLLEEAIEARNAAGNSDSDSVVAAHRAQIRQAAEMFEAYFLQVMFREMRRTGIDDDGFVPKSHAERIFTEMLDEQVATQAASSGGFGLADMLYAQMTRQFDL